MATGSSPVQSLRFHPSPSAQPQSAEATLAAATHRALADPVVGTAHAQTGRPRSFSLGAGVVVNVRDDEPVDEARERQQALAREQLAGLLLQRPFRDGDPAQRELERLYLEWAAGVHVARALAFGSLHHCQPGQDMSAHARNGAWVAMFEGALKFVSSSSRSPFRNVLGNVFGSSANTPGVAGRGEFDNTYDPTVISGLVAGLTAYLAQAIVLPAMKRCASEANYPTLKPVAVEILVPSPGPVELTLVDGCKQYRKVTPERRQVLLAEVACRREELKKWQCLLQAQGPLNLLFLQPVATGGTNMLRRALDPDLLFRDLPLLGASALASGTASAACAIGCSLAQCKAQAEVDGLAGQRQKVNLFAVQVPRPADPPPGWRDAKRLPNYLCSTAANAAHLLTRSFSVSWRSGRRAAWQAAEVANGYMLTNAIASATSTSAGPFVSQLLRSGRLAPLPGEAPDSWANLLQQCCQSGVNDLVWNAMREVLKSLGYDLDADVRRSEANRSALAATN